MQKLIHHIIVIWDESDHVSRKHSKTLSRSFWKGYLTSFPEASATAESPTVVSTASPMFSLSTIKTFFHDGTLVPYSGKNKDLAIAKYCSTGFVDQDERFHCVVDDMRQMRYERGDPPMHADQSVLVAFVTSDRASGMNEALRFVMTKSKSYRGNLSYIQTDKSLSQGNQRMTNAGYILGLEFKRRFIRVQDKGLLLEIES